ncbi:MAG: selenium cofactor biosynthesis protein YqeC [Clostridia bacterium]
MQQPVKNDIKANITRPTSLWSALRVPRGVTAIIGGGGKTTLMLELAAELSQMGSVIVTTTTHIWPPDMMVLKNADTAQVTDALNKTSLVCVAENILPDKLDPPKLAIETLGRLADYVIVEADGSKGLPLKAHGPHEPCLPAHVDKLIYMVGLDGIGKPVSEAAHRPELYAAGLGVAQGHIITAQDAARMIGYNCTVGLNKAEGERLKTGRDMAAYLADAVILSLQSAEKVLEIWRDGRCLF